MDIEGLKTLANEYRAWKAAHVAPGRKRFEIPEAFRTRMTEACSSFSVEEVSKQIGVSGSVLQRAKTMASVKSKHKTKPGRVGFMEIKPATSMASEPGTVSTRKGSTSGRDGVAIVVVPDRLSTAEYISQIVNGVCH